MSRYQGRRIALVVALLAALGAFVSACAAPTPTASNTQGGAGIVISTPNGADQSPTPTFPDFTVGAWPSNFSPNPNDTITIYVLCRTHDKSMNIPAQPAAGVSVTVAVDGGGVYSGSTDAQGLAAIQITLKDATPGKPVRVYIRATGPGGKTYNAETFYTAAPAAAPSPTATTPGGGQGGTPGPGGTPPAKGTPPPNQ